MRSKGGRRTKRSAQTRDVGESRNYLRFSARLAEEISVDTLAGLVELSPFHFSRVFKQTTGLSPLQFVNRERITRAQQMMRAVTAANGASGASDIDGKPRGSGNERDASASSNGRAFKRSAA